jgi:hypothetical protein
MQVVAADRKRDQGRNLVQVCAGKRGDPVCGVALLGGRGWLAGPGVVDVVLADGADPITPPIPGLRERAGIWTNREVTNMKAVPRRSVVLGGDALGPESGERPQPATLAIRSRGAVRPCAPT